MNVINYVVEEVSRQGHNVLRLDGIERVGWMLDGWSYALQNSDRKPTVDDAIIIGRRVEREVNKLGIRTCDVWVGRHMGLSPERINSALVALFENQINLTPLDFYREFEEIHPFEDGNGRTGKILLNWRNGSLDVSPIFPPDDFWGYPIRNP